MMNAPVYSVQDAAVVNTLFREVKRQQGHSATYPGGNSNEVKPFQPVHSFGGSLFHVFVIVIEAPVVFLHLFRIEKYKVFLKERLFCF